MKKINLLVLLLCSLLFVGCAKDTSTDNNNNNENENIPTREDFTTEITDSVTLTKDYAGKSFLADGIGEVEFRSHVDGDTTWFYDNNYTGPEKKKFSLRYFGIDTPESTALVQPWGIKASKFTKECLSKAEKIVLDRDVAEVKTGTRYLGLVWIKDEAHPNFYCLNLLIVEQGYSVDDIKMTSPLYQKFKQAETNARATGKRIYGYQNDPDYDYSDTAKNTTIHDILAHSEEYYASGKVLVLDVVIVRKATKGYYLRSYEVDENGEYSYIYLFTFGKRFDPAFNNVGSAIKIHCKAGEFQGRPQLTEPNLDSLDADGPVSLTDDLIETSNIVIDSTNNSLNNALYVPVEAHLTVTAIQDPDDNGDRTIQCNITGTKKHFNIRINSHYYGMYEDILKVGNNVIAKGIAEKYFNNYQVIICNEINDVEDITLA